MRRCLIVVSVASIALGVALPAPVTAQHWTAEEQGLLDALKSCWDSWMEAVRAADPEIHFRKCAWVENSSMWWTEFGAPEGQQMVRRNFEKFVVTDIDWLDIRPVSVRIWGDVGMVQFYGYWNARTPDGPTVTEYKRTEVFRRVDGRWVFLGGQGTPASAADAQPYKE